MHDLIPIRQPAPSEEHDQAARPGNRARGLVIGSGRGDVGSSSIAINLALELCDTGHRVCLFDADSAGTGVGLLLGLAARGTLQQLLGGECTLDQLLLEGPGGLWVVPAAGDLADFIRADPDQQRRLLRMLGELEQRFDYLVIDAGSGIHRQLIQLPLAADDLLMVITPEPASVDDAFSALKRLKRYGFERPVQVLVNKAENRTQAHDSFQRLRSAALRFLQLDTHYLGYVLSDATLGEAARQRRPLILSDPDAIASHCLHAIGIRLQRHLDRAASGGLGEFYRHLQSSERRGDRATPRAAAVTGEAALSAVATGNQTGGRPAADEGGLLSATYYASLLGAVEGGDRG